MIYRAMVAILLGILHQKADQLQGQGNRREEDSLTSEESSDRETKRGELKDSIDGI